MAEQLSGNSSIIKMLTISEIRAENSSFKTFTFSTGNDTISYKAGQYLTLLLPGHLPEIRRSYSLISTPALPEPLAIGVKRIENGAFSRYLIDHARVGDKIETTGAAGFFTLPDTVSTFRQVFFMAAGSGITPILSLIKTLLFSYPAIAVVLIYSNRSHEDAIYTEDLKTLQAEFSARFRIEFLFSNAADLSRARLYKDLLQYFVAAHAITTPDKILAYLCGPENYMRMCVYGLTLAGLPPENIRKENFSTRKIITKAEPADKALHQVSVKMKDEVYKFEAQFPATILQAARKNGVILPYSCEAGKCGSCVARCTSGEVWMSYNEVLTDHELQKGLILTCVGYPVGGDIALEIN